jgi:hypothetical protein
LTADPVRKALQGFDFTKPNNVTTWINYYENGDAIARLHGNPVTGATNKELLQADFAEFAARYKGGAAEAYAHAHQNGLIVEQSSVIGSLKDLLKNTPATRTDFKK